MSAVEKRKGPVSPAVSILPIEGEMTIYRAAELKQALVEAIDRGAALEIDLSAVSEIDTAGVQLLILARKLAQSKRQELRLTGHSPAVLEAIELLNLGACLGEDAPSATSEASP